MSERIPRKIVLAADDSILRASYARDLRAAGHEVWEAEDGGQALALVRARAPGLLLIDRWLPTMNGLEVLERLKSVTEAVGLTVVILSNDIEADARLEGSALGVADWWRKDLSAVELCGRVEQVMKAAHPSFERGG